MCVFPCYSLLGLTCDGYFTEFRRNISPQTEYVLVGCVDVVCRPHPVEF